MNVLCALIILIINPYEQQQHQRSEPGLEIGTLALAFRALTTIPRLTAPCNCDSLYFTMKTMGAMNETFYRKKRESVGCSPPVDLLLVKLRSQ